MRSSCESLKPPDRRSRQIRPEAAADVQTGGQPIRRGRAANRAAARAQAKGKAPPAQVAIVNDSIRGTSAVSTPRVRGGSEAVIVPTGEITHVSPVAAHRTRQRRDSTARNCESRRCCASVSGCGNAAPLISETNRLAEAAASDRAADGTMSS